jgi:hypothetical protein
MTTTVSNPDWQLGLAEQYTWPSSYPSARPDLCITIRHYVMMTIAVTNNIAFRQILNSLATDIYT